MSKEAEKEEKQKPEKNENSEKIAEQEPVKEENLTEKLKKEIEVLKEKNLRLLADLNNQAKIHAKEINEIVKYSNERFLRQLLFFPDNYERALQFSQNDPDPKIQNFLTGFQMVLTEFQNFLKKQGVEEIQITPHKDIYDRKLHEDLLKVEEIEENNDCPDGTILQVLQKGYQIHQRILRPVMVKISKTKEIKNEEKK